ncbi:methylase [Glutamicibacter soli]|uniref:Methylase n=1 Tax=Glutamicibacter soli TaxID=453836 RepID=A0A365YL27_9MICC|nr:methylase [Glutamicibacter soli]RBM02960.1 methylase [Glutamicibacter soli]
MTALTPDEQLIKSRHRVRTHGEVFTPRSMVKQMLDLVKTELETGPNFVDKTFFEPAAGDGNFLVAILWRKLHAIEKRYQPAFWQTETLFALASIYGIELLKDNHQAAQDSLLDIFVEFHERAGNSCGPRTNLYRSATMLIECNILQGNTLTGLDAAGDEIQFSWWHRVLNEPGMVHREPFSLSSLRNSSTGKGMFDFALYESYEVCRVEHVYKEVKANV